MTAVGFWDRLGPSEGKVDLKPRGAVRIRAALCLLAAVGCGRTTLDLPVSVEGSGGSGESLQPAAHTSGNTVGAGGYSAGGPSSTWGTTSIGATSTTGVGV